MIRTGLPLGLSATSQWLRVVGQATGREAAAEALIRDGLDRVVPRLAHPVARVLAGKRAVVCAEPALADGLRCFLGDVGVEVASIVYRCRSRAGVEGRLPPDPDRPPVRHWDPSARSLAAVMAEAARDDPVDLLIGSSWEREAALRAGVPFLEIGFPSVHWRPLVPSPRLGFEGALHLTQRMLQALLDARYWSGTRRAL